MVDAESQSVGRAPRGFTLLEMVIALALLAMLLAMAAISVGGWMDRADLDEGADRFASALRQARLDARITGRRIRMVCQSDGEDGARFAFEWEPDPFEAPGQFVPYDAPWCGSLPTQLVRIERCELIGDSALKAAAIADMTAGGDEEDAVLRTIEFGAGRDCDWARIVLRSTSESDPRRAVVVLEGDRGRVTSKVLSAADYETLADQYDASPRDLVTAAAVEPLEEDE